jgi:hypothetical protein
LHAGLWPGYGLYLAIHLCNNNNSQEYYFSIIITHDSHKGNWPGQFKPLHTKIILLFYFVTAIKSLTYRRSGVKDGQFSGVSLQSTLGI